MTEFDINAGVTNRFYSSELGNKDVDHKQQVGQTGWAGKSDIFSLGGQGVSSLFLNYNASAGHPSLIKPSENPSETVPTDLPSTQDEKMVDDYFTKFSTALGTIADKYDLSTEDVNKFIFASLTGSQPDGSKLMAPFKEFQQANSQFASQSQDPGRLNTLLQTVKENYLGIVNKNYTEAFEANLAKATLPPPKGQGLSEETAAKIRNAFYSPETADPSVKEQVEQFKEAARNQVASKMGLPSDYTPKADGTKFAAQLSSDYQEAFEKALDQAIADKNLPPDAAKALKDQTLYAHAFPTSKSLNPEAKMLAQQLEQQIKANFFAAHALSPNFVIDADPSFAAKLDGMLSFEFSNVLRNWRPPLDGKTQQALQKALANPNDPNISPEIKALLKQILGTSVQNIRAQYHLPDDWEPSEAALKSISNGSGFMEVGARIIDSMQETIGLVLKAVKNMPSGAEKDSFLNLIAVVTQALVTLKEQIAQAQMALVGVTGKLQQAKTQCQLDKIEKQQHEIREHQKQMRKLAPLMTFMKVLGPLKYLFIIVLALLGGPMLGWLGMVMAMATALLVIVDDIMGKGGPLKLLMEAIEKISDNKGIQVLLKFLVSLIFMVTGGIFLGVTMLFENTKVLEAALEAVGVPKMAAMIINMVIEIALNIVVMVAMSILIPGSAFAPLISKAIATVAKILAKIAEFIMKACEMIMKLIKEIIKLIKQAFEVIKDALSELISSLGSLFSKGGEAAGDGTKVVGEVGSKVGSEVASSSDDLFNVSDDLFSISDDIFNLSDDVLFNVDDVANSSTKVADISAEGVEEALVAAEAGGDAGAGVVGGVSEGTITVVTEAPKVAVTGVQTTSTIAADLGQDAISMTIRSADEVAQALEEGAEITMDVIKNTTKSLARRCQDFIKRMEEAAVKWNDMANNILKGGDEGKAAYKAFKEEVDLLRTLMYTANVAQGFLGAAQGAVAMSLGIIKAQFNMMMKDLEALIALLGGQIKALQKLIDSLFNGLTSLSDWYAELGKLQGARWKSLSAVVTSGSGALQG